MARAMPSAVQPLPLEIGVPPGRAVVRQGEPCPRPMVVARGAVYVSTVDDQGRVLGLDVVGPGRRGGRSARRARARHGAGAWEPVGWHRRPIAGSPHSFNEREQRLWSFACQLAWLDVPGRVHHRMHDLAHRFGRPVPGGALIALGTHAGAAGAPVRHVAGIGQPRVAGVGRPRGASRSCGRGRYVVAVGSDFVGVLRGVAALLQHHQAAGAAVAGATLHRLAAPFARSRRRHRPGRVVPVHRLVRPGLRSPASAGAPAPIVPRARAPRAGSRRRSRRPSGARR